MLDENSEFCYAYRLLPKEEFSPAKVFVLISAKSPVGSTMTQRFSCFHCAALLLRVGLAGPTAGTRGLHAGARFLGEGRSISAQSPQARVRPAVPTACTPAQELGIVFFCVLRKETKQTVGAGVSKGSHSRNLESRFFLHNKASCGSPINTYVHCHIRGAGFRSHPCRNLGGGAAVGTGQVKIAGRRNMCPLS